MIAKLVDPLRRTAHRRSALLVDTLEATEVAGSVTNLAFLAALAARPRTSRSGDVDTGLIGPQAGGSAAAPCPRLPAIVSAAVIGRLRLDRRPAVRTTTRGRTLSGYAHFHPIERQTSAPEVRKDEEIVARFVSRRSRRRTAGKQVIRRRVSKRRAGRPRTVSPVSASPHSPSLARPCDGTCFRAARRFRLRRAAILCQGSGSGRRAQAACARRCPASSRSCAPPRRRRHEGTAAARPRSDEDGAHHRRASHDGVVAEIAAEGAQITEGTVLVTFEEANASRNEKAGRARPFVIQRRERALRLDRRVFAVVPLVDVVGGVLDVALLVEGDLADDRV